jgi:hypothetical protein
MVSPGKFVLFPQLMLQFSLHGISPFVVYVMF